MATRVTESGNIVPTTVSGSIAVANRIFAGNPNTELNLELKSEDTKLDVLFDSVKALRLEKDGLTLYNSDVDGYTPSKINRFESQTFSTGIPTFEPSGVPISGSLGTNTTFRGRVTRINDLVILAWTDFFRNISSNPPSPDNQVVRAGPIPASYRPLTTQVAITAGAPGTSNVLVFPRVQFMWTELGTDGYVTFYSGADDAYRQSTFSSSVVDSSGSFGSGVIVYKIA